MFGMASKAASGEATGMAASATPGVVQGWSDTPSIVTGPTSVTVTGAIGAVTHSWTRVSGGTGSARYPDRAFTEFIATGVVSSGSYGGVFQDTITDSAGNVAYATVSATFERL